MKCGVCITACLLLPLSARAEGNKIAFLKGVHVFVAEADGKNAKQIDSDQRRKALLRWDVANQHFAYVADPNGDEKARFVTIDLSGKIIRDVPIRPPTDPPTSGMQYIERLEFLPDGKIRIGGSFTPWNCEAFDLDLGTGKESNGQIGKCGTFALSPDGKHYAACATIPQTDDEHRFDTVEIDGWRSRNGPLASYSGTSHSRESGIFVLAGPAWSPDSRRAAVIEKRSTDQQLSVTILSLAGDVRRVRVASGLSEHPTISWFGSKIVAGEGIDAVAIDPVEERLETVPFEVSDELAHRVRVREEGKVSREKLEAVVRKLGGRDGVEITTKPSQ